MVTDVAFKWRRSDYGSSKLFSFYTFQQLVFPGNIQHRCLFNTSQHRIPLTAKSLNYFHLLRSGFFGRSQGDVRQATYGLLGSVGHLKTLRKVDNLRGLSSSYIRLRGHDFTQKHCYVDGTRNPLSFLSVYHIYCILTLAVSMDR